MTKTDIIKSLQGLTRVERDEILHLIVMYNNDEDMKLSPEQKELLNRRIDESESGKVKSLDGHVVIAELAEKYGLSI